MEAPVPMNNKSKTLPPYGSMMPPFSHHPPALHGPPPGPPRIPPREGQPHGLPAPIPHANTYEQPWRQHPYPPPHFDSPVERRHSTPVTNPPPPQSQPQPPPTHIPYPTAPHPAQQQQSRELPQLPPADPYHRPNSLPTPGPSHSLTENHSPREHYRPMNGAQPEPTPHSAPPPPNEYRPYTGPPESPGPVTTNGDHTGPPPVYMPGVPPSYHGQPPPGAAYDASNIPFSRQRKAARAQQACDQCRARKAKCDEGRPSCSHCKENNVICVYKEVPPHKQEKTTQIILDRIERKEEVMKDLLETIVKKIAATDSRVDKLFDYFSEHGHAIPDQKSPAKPTTAPDPKKKSEKEHKDEGSLIKENKNESIVTIESYNELLDKEPSQVLPQDMKVEEEEGGLSIPIEHTTAAHKLLSWPSISRLLDRRVDEDYVLTNERKRGLIRIYGCGEGRDHDTEYNYPRARPEARPEARPITAATDSPATTASTSSPHFDDDHSQASSPNWGYGLPITPNSRPGERHGGLDQTGYLNTQPDVVRAHYRSFLDNIYILHPFLDIGSLGKKVDRFIRQYGYRKSIGNSAGDSRGVKRKRSTEGMHMGPHDMSRSPSMNSERRIHNNRIERSIDNAIVLMVLALGAICEHKGPIPGFAPDPSGRSQIEAFPVSPEAQAVFNDILSPASGPVSALTGQSFSSSSVPSPEPDFKTPTPRPVSNKFGQDGYSEDSYPKNVDVIPGLAYYAYAAGILGDLQGGNELPYVQAAILASFYAGQLAHPFQSHGWIFQAARACQFIVRARDYDVMEIGPLKELYEFAFWTCLQHESDLLAELDLAASGISRFESRIALPAGLYTLTLPNEIDAPETRMMFNYSAQIHLRKVLNRVHTDLYKVSKNKKRSDNNSDRDMEDYPEEKTDKDLNIPTKVLQVLGMNLDEWKGNLPTTMQWEEKEPPSSDINTARLRAKYYGARYIIYRPLLHYALHQLHPSKPESSAHTESHSFAEQSEPKRRAPQAPSMARWASESGTSQLMEDEPNIFPTVKFESLDPQIQTACKHCIRAAVQSTIAFDGVQGRPIVTNIFGTAHAQFGNMLVLSATYMSGLRQLVERDELERLLKRTIRFLAQSKDISPTLRADAQILSGIYHKIFKQSPHTSFSTESFGPNT